MDLERVEQSQTLLDLGGEATEGKAELHLGGGERERLPPVHPFSTPFLSPCPVTQSAAQDLLPRPCQGTHGGPRCKRGRRQSRNPSGRHTLPLCA